MNFPLECVCSHRTERFQLAFARRALELLDNRPDCAYEARGSGLLIRGETEESIGHPLNVLKAAFADEIHVGEFTILYQLGSIVQEPHMGLRIACAVELGQVVRTDLEERKARIIHAEVVRSMSVVDATAPLKKLLGYSEWLRSLSGGSARVVMWLSHYAPVPPHPPPSDHGAA